MKMKFESTARLLSVMAPTVMEGKSKEEQSELIEIIACATLSAYARELIDAKTPQECNIIVLRLEKYVKKNLVNLEKAMGLTDKEFQEMAAEEEKNAS